jgi:feruloyl esterase
MRRAPALLVAAMTPLAFGVSTTAATPASAGTPACQSVARPQVPGAAVQSVTGVDVPAGPLQIPGGPTIALPAHCEVTIVLTHPGAGDTVGVSVWLPATGWNGRFQGTGGGGYSASLGPIGLAAAVAQGYAAAATDAGVTTDPTSPAAWALRPDGSVNEALLLNFASRSVHDMTVAAKQVVTGFYDRSAAYSYWNGCSTGGRQGLMEAQRYPTDYNGVVATAPAINWDRFIPAELWPQVVMNHANDHPGPCVFNAFTQAAIAACDRGDPVNGGLVDQPDGCRFDPRGLIGRTVVCDGTTVTITATDADMVRQIWQGPTVAGVLPLWYGLPKGAPFDALAATTAAADGTRVGAPFPIADAWVRYFLKRQPGFDTATITPAQFDVQFAQSRIEYNRIIGTDDPNLAAFRNAGGKMVTWHGLADPLIFPQGTVNYYQRVQATLGGATRVADFYRLFLAPGVGHCGGGRGPVPTDPLGAVVNWVEKGQAPATLPSATTGGGGTAITRDLCPYPEIARYDGHSDPDSAASYHCAT